MIVVNIVLNVYYLDIINFHLYQLDQILDEIKTNTLVTTGQHDVGSTTDMAINLSENIKGAKYVEIKNGKHLCNIECAKDFNKTIELFIDQNYDES